MLTYVSSQLAKKYLESRQKSILSPIYKQHQETNYMTVAESEVTKYFVDASHFGYGAQRYWVAFP